MGGVNSSKRDGRYGCFHPYQTDDPALPCYQKMEDMDMTGVTKEKFGDSSTKVAQICGEIGN